MAARKSNVRGSAHITTDHQRIQEWVEERGGHPAVVSRTRGSRGPGILRIDFPGFSGEGSLEPIDWNGFFKAFDQAELAFLYQEETGSGRPSRFNKFVHRDTMSFDDGGIPRGRAQTARSSAVAKKRRAKSSNSGVPRRAAPTTLLWPVPTDGKKRPTKARAATSPRGVGSRGATKKVRSEPARSKARPAATRARTRRSA